MNIVQKPTFARAYKKLHANQLPLVNNAISEIASNPLIGDEKKGDLAGVRVYKFKVLDQQFLLAYETETNILLTLMALGVHENF